MSLPGVDSTGPSVESRTPEYALGCISDPIPLKTEDDIKTSETLELNAKAMNHESGKQSNGEEI